MSVANETQAVPLAHTPPAAVVTTSLWDRPALFRYGFVVLTLIVWEIVGPFISEPMEATSVPSSAILARRFLLTCTFAPASRICLRKR